MRILSQALLDQNCILMKASVVIVMSLFQHHPTTWQWLEEYGSPGAPSAGVTLQRQPVLPPIPVAPPISAPPEIDRVADAILHAVRQQHPMPGPTLEMLGGLWRAQGKGTLLKDVVLADGRAWTVLNQSWRRARTRLATLSCIPNVLTANSRHSHSGAERLQLMQVGTAVLERAKAECTCADMLANAQTAEDEGTQPKRVSTWTEEQDVALLQQYMATPFSSTVRPVVPGRSEGAARRRLGRLRHKLAPRMPFPASMTDQVCFCSRICNLALCSVFQVSRLLFSEGNGISTARV